ncbi:MAG TPA: GNAT family N-acetyltransferase [Longimicrobium sp.]|nr:GNAT family N-acetyltransferase [Longimicrobium sp.]
MTPVIRRATPDDAGALTRIAHAARSHRGYPDAWIGDWRDALTLTPGYIPAHEVFAAANDDGPRGFYALSPRGETAVVDHLWIEPAWMGRGPGRALLEHAMDTARALGATRMEIDSDPHAEAFYRRMGARRIGVVPAGVEGVARVLPRMEINH